MNMNEGSKMVSSKNSRLNTLLTFHTLPWLLGWISLSVVGPFMMAKIVYKTVILTLTLFLKKKDEFLGKTVVITGASSGLGISLAESFYKRGCRVILLARNLKALEDVKTSLLQKYNPPGLHVPVIEYLDLEDLNSMPSLVEKLTTSYGPIDILINNAGISYRGTIAETDISVDLKLMVTNYFGQVALTKEILKGMIKRKSGHIIGISSIQAKIALPYRSCYTASKHAFQSFFDCLRSEVAQYNIFVSIVCPSYMKTDLSINALTGSGDKYSILDSTTASGMEPEYVAERTACMYITKDPEILLCPYLHKLIVYVRHYFPSLAFYYMKFRARYNTGNESSVSTNKKSMSNINGSNESTKENSNDTNNESNKQSTNNDNIKKTN